MKRAIRDSGLHHIRYRHDARRGLDGLAFAMGSVLAGIRPVMNDLDDTDGQRLVLIRAVTPGKRHDITDPRVDPPPYWPSRSGQPAKRRRRRASNSWQRGGAIYVWRRGRCICPPISMRRSGVPQASVAYPKRRSSVTPCAPRKHASYASSRRALPQRCTDRPPHRGASSWARRTVKGVSIASVRGSRPRPGHRPHR